MPSFKFKTCRLLEGNVWNRELTITSAFHVYLIFWKQKMLQLFPIPNMSQRVYILVHFFFYILLFKVLGYLLMDELHRAVAPFLHSSGGGLPGGSMGHGGGGGGAPFDVGLFVANENADPADMGAAEPHQNRARGEWDELRSSREWRSVEKHFARCDRRIGAIFEKARAMYRDGRLALDIEDESDIQRGLGAYFADLHDLPSNEHRLRRLKRVAGCLGNARSPIWAKIKRLIEL